MSILSDDSYLINVGIDGWDEKLAETFIEQPVFLTTKVQTIVDDRIRDELNINYKIIHMPDAPIFLRLLILIPGKRLPDNYLWDDKPLTPEELYPVCILMDELDIIAFDDTHVESYGDMINYFRVIDKYCMSPQLTKYVKFLSGIIGYNKHMNATDIDKNTVLYSRLSGKNRTLTEAIKSIKTVPSESEKSLASESEKSLAYDFGDMGTIKDSLELFDNFEKKELKRIASTTKKYTPIDIENDSNISMSVDDLNELIHLINCCFMVSDGDKPTEIKKPFEFSVSKTKAESDSGPEDSSPRTTKAPLFSIIDEPQPPIITSNHMTTLDLLIKGISVDRFHCQLIFESDIYKTIAPYYNKNQRAKILSSALKILYLEECIVGKQAMTHRHLLSYKNLENAGIFKFPIQQFVPFPKLDSFVVCNMIDTNNHKQPVTTFIAGHPKYELANIKQNIEKYIGEGFPLQDGMYITGSLLLTAIIKSDLKCSLPLDIYNLDLITGKRVILPKKIALDIFHNVIMQKYYDFDETCITLLDKSKKHFQVFVNRSFIYARTHSWDKSGCLNRLSQTDTFRGGYMHRYFYNILYANEIIHNRIVNSLDIDIFHSYESETKPIIEDVIDHLIVSCVKDEPKEPSRYDVISDKERAYIYKHRKISDGMLKLSKAFLPPKPKKHIADEPEITELNEHHQEIAYKDKKVDLYHGTIGGIAKYHLPMVRMAYDGDDIKIMPSCLIYLLTGISVDYRWFKSVRSVLDIMGKYVDRDMLCYQVLHKVEARLLRGVTREIRDMDISRRLCCCEKSSEYFVTG
jgi:hypothetical protein